MCGFAHWYGNVPIQAKMCYTSDPGISARFCGDAQKADAMRVAHGTVVALLADSPRAVKPSVYSSGNRLLDALPQADRADLEGDLEIITLAAHKFTHSVGGVVDHVDFPIDAVL